MPLCLLLFHARMKHYYSPILSTMGQKRAHLPYFEKAKTFFPIVSRAVAEVYLCEKKFGRFAALQILKSVTVLHLSNFRKRYSS